MKELTNKENEIIGKNLSAFNQSFKEAKIYKYNKYYYIFQNVDKDYNNWKYVSNNIQEIKGWLYGAVQALYTLEVVPAKYTLEKLDKKEI